jgi:hypothetical protein
MLGATMTWSLRLMAPGQLPTTTGSPHHSSQATTTAQVTAGVLDSALLKLCFYNSNNAGNACLALHIAILDT